MSLHFNELETLVVAILAIYLGKALHRRFVFLERNHIPCSVTGGSVVALIIALLTYLFDFSLSVASTPKSILLLLFFANIGLTAQLRDLAKGGKGVALLCVAIALIIPLQNIIGVGIAYIADLQPKIGLFLGSIPLIGGHGTNAAWGQSSYATTLDHVLIIGVAMATLGLIMGGFVGGPVASWLLKKNATFLPVSPADIDTASPSTKESDTSITMDETRILRSAFVLLGTLLLGEILNKAFSLLFIYIRGEVIVIPGFLTVMLTGMLIINVLDRSNRWVDTKSIQIAGSFALELFLAISLLSVELWQLVPYIGLIVLAMVVQIIVVVGITIFLLHRMLGRNYTAVVVSGGFIGFALGAMPVAMGVIQKITEKHGKSSEGLLIVTLAAALFTDVANTFVILLGFEILP